MPIVFTTRNRNKRCAKQGCESEEDAGEVGAWAVDVALACDEEGEVAESAEGETAMSAWETAPPVV